MWIYEQTKSEENFSLLPQTVGLPVQTAESALSPRRHRQLNRQNN